MLKAGIRHLYYICNSQDGCRCLSCFFFVGKTYSKKHAMQDTMLLIFMELLNDDSVVQQVRVSLYPQEMADKIDPFTQTISEQNRDMETKERRIAALK